MKIFQADYVQSAPDLKHCPDFGDTPEFVMVGRSNVGKSSFINSLTARKNLARTSNTPGKTRHINFYRITAGNTTQRHSLVLVDLPGYGYAKVSKTEQQHWQKNLEAYLTQRQQIRLVLQMIDIRHEPQPVDIQMLEWLMYHKLPTQIILTKSDKVSKNVLKRQQVLAAKVLGREAAVEADALITFSATTHLGREEAWKCLAAKL